MGERKKSLAEYAAEHPQEMPEPERKAQAAAARTYRERQEAEQQTADLKAQILQKLEQGAAPQDVLYSAIRAIGSATNDPAWAAAAQGNLDRIYADLAQQSFLTDEAAIAADRLKTRHDEYAGKVRRQLLRQLKGCQQLEKELQEALQAAEQMQPQEDTQGT